MRKLLSIAAFCLVLFVPFTANAQDKGASKQDEYSYEFDDDPLSASGFGPNDSTIRVRRGARRSTLIKPRTSFIKELIWSVEQL